MTEPTERPWKIEDRAVYPECDGGYRKTTQHGFIIHGQEGGEFDGFVGDIFVKRGQNGPEDAAHIVHCVNLHDELVAALRGLVNLPDSHTLKQGVAVYERCQAVLAKARLEDGAAKIDAAGAG